MKIARRNTLLAGLLVAVPTVSALAETPPLTDGEVRKIDRENAKITLKHAEIKNLDMPPMTMVFSVSDPKLLDGLKTGDKVQFRAVNEGGKLTVTELQSGK